LHKRLLTLFSGLLAATTAMPVHAASFTATPPIAVVYPEQGLYCAVTNLGKDVINVRVDIVSPSGAVVTGGSPLPLAPGATAAGGAVSDQINGFVYCRADGFSSDKIHLTACVTTSEAVASGIPSCLSSTTAP
jgi:hypothetical protein